MVNIGIGGEVEVYEHPHQTVVGVDGIHVIHVIHAAHLLLDGSGNGLLDCLGVRAHIVRLDVDFRWNNFGKLGHWQADQRNEADNDHNNGNYHRNNWAVNEE